MRLPDIRRRVLLPHPVPAVWTALTDPDALADWLMPNDFRAEIGHRFLLRTEPRPGFDGVVHAEVVELEPMSRMVWRWRGGGIDTAVTFELAEADGGTELTLVHAGFGAGDALARLILGPGWRRLLSRSLTRTLDGRTPRAPSNPPPAPPHEEPFP